MLALGSEAIARLGCFCSTVKLRIPLMTQTLLMAALSHNGNSQQHFEEEHSTTVYLQWISAYRQGGLFLAWWGRSPSSFAWRWLSIRSGRALQRCPFKEFKQYMHVIQFWVKKSLTVCQKLTTSLQAIKQGEQKSLEVLHSISLYLVLIYSIGIWYSTG